MTSLDEASYISLRTFRRSGAPVDTPVWFAQGDPQHYYVFSAADAGKVKRLRLSPRAQIATCNARGSSLGPWQDCHAYLIDEAAEIRTAHDCLTKKYGWQMRMTDFFSRLTGRINKRAFIRIES